MQRNQIRGLDRPLTADELMTTDVVTINQDMTILQAARQVLERRVSNAPVVVHDFTRNMLVGFVSEKDLLQCYADGEFYRRPDMKVSEVMHKHPVCVQGSTDLFTLAAVFMQHGYRHVPVVKAGMLQGVVSRRDVLHALVANYVEWSLQDPAKRQAPDLNGIFTHRYLVS